MRRGGELIDRAIEKIRLAARISDQYYHKPLMVTYSGGKDSEVLLDLTLRSGVEFEVVHSHTSVDAPQTYYHVNDVFNRLEDKGIKCTRLYATRRGERITMWNLIPEKGMPPTRIVRYCCDVLKEQSTPNRFIALGVRRSESKKRGGYGDYRIRGREVCHYTFERIREAHKEAQIYDEVYDCRFIAEAKKNKDLLVSPILDWTDSDVWRYIREKHIKYNPLYNMGYMRVGCIGCPLAGNKRWKEFRDHPAYMTNYILAFERMLDVKKEKGMKTGFWKCGRDVFDWWMEKRQTPGQMEFDFERRHKE